MGITTVNTTEVDNILEPPTKEKRFTLISFIGYLNTITTPVNISLFKTLLHDHPDPGMVQYLVDGLTHGFDIGATQVPNMSRPKNHRSALDHPDDVSKAIKKELNNGHIAGPFTAPPLHNLHCSPLGARAKDDGSYRLIMDLSYPFGDSVNEHISKEDYSVQYTGFDSATDMVREMGRNCFMFKMDIKMPSVSYRSDPRNGALCGSNGWASTTLTFVYHSGYAHHPVYSLASLTPSAGYFRTSTTYPTQFITPTTTSLFLYYLTVQCTTLNWL